MNNVFHALISLIESERLWDRHANFRDLYQHSSVKVMTIERSSFDRKLWQILLDFWRTHTEMTSLIILVSILKVESTATTIILHIQLLIQYCEWIQKGRKNNGEIVVTFNSGLCTIFLLLLNCSCSCAVYCGFRVWVFIFKLNTECTKNCVEWNIARIRFTKTERRNLVSWTHL